MKPYSEDLRERVVAACAEARRTVGEVAAQFRVSVSFVHKLRRRQRTTGSVAALPRRGGPAPLLDAAARRPGPRPVGGLCGPITRRHARGIAGPPGGRRRPGRGPDHGLEGVARTGFAAQKKSVHAAERDTERVKDLRRAFLEMVQHEDVTRSKFVDEMRFKHWGSASTWPIRAATAGPWAGGGSTRPCRCTTGRTERSWRP